MLRTSESTAINPEGCGHSVKKQKQSNKYYMFQLSLASYLIGTDHLQLSSLAAFISSRKEDLSYSEYL